MEIIETKAEGLKREFKVAVATADVEARTAKRLREIAQTIKMPGFRPGKVPLSLIERKYGVAVRGEVMEQVVGESSKSVLSERGLRIAGRPSIDVVSADAGGKLEYVMALELLPEVAPLDYSRIRLERLVAEPEPDVAEQRLQLIARNLGERRPISETRGAQDGDVVVADIVATVGGADFDGNRMNAHQFELGHSGLPEGFDAQLIGARSGEHRQVTVSVPATARNPAVAGKEVVFDVTVTEIFERQPLPIDDALAARLGLDGIDILRKNIVEERARELKSLSRQRLKRSLLDALAAMYDFEVPQSMVEREIEGIVRQIHGNAAGGAVDTGIAQATQGGDDLDPGQEREFGHDHDHDHDHDHCDHPDHQHAATAPAAPTVSAEQIAEYRQIAERRVRLGLVLAEVGRLNNLHITPEELHRAVNAEARRYPGQERAVVEYFRTHPEAAQALAGPIIEEKVVDFVLEMGTVSERVVSIDELIRAASTADEEEPAAVDDAAATAAPLAPATS